MEWKISKPPANSNRTTAYIPMRLLCSFAYPCSCAQRSSGAEASSFDQRLCASVFRKVHAFDVGLAGIAALHADVIEIAGGKDRKLAVVFLATSRANDPAKLPLGEAERTDHGSRAAIAHLAQHTETGLAIAERTQGVRCRNRTHLRSGTQQFGVGLKVGRG